jgi:hypothetical protein
MCAKQRARESITEGTTNKAQAKVRKLKISLC